MKSLEINQRVGNLKTDKVGKIASSLFGSGSDFNGYIILTDHYGYEVWTNDVIVSFPPDFVESSSPPAV